jgi:1-acyl-sn-glycerol-3-phosphate acyltransferase
MKSLLERLFRERGFLWYGFSQFLTIVFFSLFYRYRVFGRENVPREGGALLASTHQSFFDPVLVGLFLPRQIRQLARRSLFRNPVFARLIRSLGAIPIDRGRSDRRALAQGIETLEEGHLLLVFPEGTRTPDGNIGKLKTGIFLMARRAQVPVVPVAIEGAFSAWPRWRRLPALFGGIRVAFGSPIEAGTGREMPKHVKEAMGRLKARLEKVKI